jgi:hypothetical protein
MKIIKISGCVVCPYRIADTSTVGTYNTCSKVCDSDFLPKLIDTILSPDWCPLEDYKKQEVADV